jgi:hypothetical protein
VTPAPGAGGDEVGEPLLAEDPSGRGGGLGDAGCSRADDPGMAAEARETGGDMRWSVAAVARALGVAPATLRTWDRCPVRFVGRLTGRTVRSGIRCARALPLPPICPEVPRGQGATGC